MQLKAYVAVVIASRRKTPRDGVGGEPDELGIRNSLWHIPCSRGTMVAGQLHKGGQPVKKIVVFALIALALVLTALPVAASGPQPPYIIIQHQVQPGETCPQLDSDYWLPNGTTCSINQRQDLLVGEYIRVPTRAGQRPARSRLYYDAGPGLKPSIDYPPGYNANLWD